MRGHQASWRIPALTSMRHAAALSVAAVLLLAASSASAQWQVDAYLGAPFFRGEDISIVGESAVPIAVFGSPRDSGEVAAGIRVGHWWSLPDPIDVGLALDGSGVFGELGNADFNFTPITALLMARLRMLPSEEFPGGRLQPYIGAGPSLIWSQLDLGLFSDNRFDLGGDARGGVRYGLCGGLGIFGEYRYTFFTPRYSDDFFGVDSRVDVKLDSSVHHLNFGFSWGF